MIHNRKLFEASKSKKIGKSQDRAYRPQIVWKTTYLQEVRMRNCTLKMALKTENVAWKKLGNSLEFELPSGVRTLYCAFLPIAFMVLHFVYFHC